MIDFTNETLISLAEVPKLLPKNRNGKPISRATIWRWTLRGVKGVVLETFDCGGFKATSREAVTRFLVALNPHNRVDILHKPDWGSPRSIRAAEKALEDL